MLVDHSESKRTVNGRTRRIALSMIVLVVVGMTTAIVNPRAFGA